MAVAPVELCVHYSVAMPSSYLFSASFRCPSQAICLLLRRLHLQQRDSHEDSDCVRRSLDSAAGAVSAMASARVVSSVRTLLTGRTLG
jgi:hypothetical protein